MMRCYLLFKNKIILVFSNFLLCSCSTLLTVQIPQNEFQTPMTSGGWLRGSVGGALSAASTTTVFVGQDSSVEENAPRTSLGIYTSKLPLYLDAGLLSNLDIYFLNPTLGFKYQVLGQANAANEWKASVRLSYSVLPTNNNLSRGTGNVINVDYADISVAYWNYGVSLGYTLKNLGTPYVAFYHRDIASKMTAENSGKQYTFDDNATQSQLAIGYATGEKLYFVLEGGITQSDWSREETKYMPYVGILFGAKVAL